TIAVLVISTFYYWPLAVLLIVAYPVYLWLTALTSKRWQRLEGTKNEHVDLASGRFNEVVGQMRVVKSFTRERSELGLFTHHFDRTVDLTREQSQYWHRMDAIRRGVLALIFFGLYAMIFLRTVGGHLSIGQMVMLVQLMAMARQPVTSVSWVVDSAQRAIAGSKSYFEVMALDPGQVARAGERATAQQHVAAAPTRAGGQARASHGEPVCGETVGGETVGGETAVLTATAPPTTTPGDATIAFEDVHFGYDEDADVIDGISFHLSPGDRVALVGESGGGKTTIVNLLL